MAEEPQNPQPEDQASPVVPQPAPQGPAAASSSQADEPSMELAAPVTAEAANVLAPADAATTSEETVETVEVVEVVDVAEPQSATAAGAQPAATAADAAPAGGTVPPPPSNAAPGAAAAVPPVPQPPAAATKPKPVFAKGCIAAAWEDVKASEGWLSRTLLLGLIACVPILNFVVLGYILNWVREVPFGGRTTMPKPIVTGRNFEVGFYAFVIAVVFGLVSGIAGAIVMWVPILGWLASIAISVFAMMALALALVRMALSKQLGEGFQVPKLWAAVKANWTGLLVASVVPGLVVGAILMVAFMVVALVLVLIMAVPLAASGAVAASSTAGAAGLIVGLGLGGALLFVLLYIVGSMGSTFAYLISYRAVAHYIGRYVPEWADEARVTMGYPQS